jgi:hypothetical protein
MGKIRSELKEFFPYKVVDIESAEADDIIATLVKEFSEFPAQDILILSGDKDFIQLHTNDNVKQYDPVRKKYIKNPDPARYLKEHILKGDSGDGVPNVLSNDNCFVVGERQKPMTQKKLDVLIEADLDESHPIYRNYMRNKQLIDLSMVPDDISAKVLESYNNQEAKGRDKLLNYFIVNKLKHLTEHIAEF